MANVDDFKKKLQADPSARDKFAADIADVLKRHGYSGDASKIKQQLESGGGASDAASWAVTIVSG